MITHIKVELEGSPVEVGSEALSLAEALLPLAGQAQLARRMAAVFKSAIANPMSEGPYGKLALIKAVRAVMCCGLGEAKDIVEGVIP